MDDETAAVRPEDTIDRLLKERADWPALLERVQEELRTIARSAKRREGDREYWRTTDLMNEINVKLLKGQAFPSGEARAQFFGYVMQIMRNTLRDHARKRKALKAGGGAVHDSIDELVGTHHEPGELTIVADDWIDLSRKLEELEKKNAKWAAALTARYVGSTLKEIADQLSVSVKTVTAYIQAGQSFIDKG